MKKLVACLALMGLWLPASPAAAYRFLCNTIDSNGNVRGSDGCNCQLSNAQRWADGFIDWRIKRAVTAVGATDWLNTAHASLDAWNQVQCKTFAMRDIGDVTTPDFGSNESQHTISWVNSAQQFASLVGSGVDSTLGVTQSPYYFVGGCNGRSTADSDIVMNNAGGNTWTTNMATCSGGCVDVQATLAHEVGHALGLGHPCTGMSNDCPAGGTIMKAVAGYRDDIGNPQADDIQGFCDLYPGQQGTQGAHCNTSNDCTGGRTCLDDNGVKYCATACGTCTSGYRCVGGFCRFAVPNVGEACTGSCAAGAFCLEDGAGARKCYQQCNPTANPTGCSGQDRCASLGQGVGACVPPGTQQPGEHCGGSLGDCRPGATCYIITQGVQDCSNSNNCQCFQNCTSATECASNQECDTSSGSPGVCLEVRYENQACLDSGTFVPCASGLICLYDDASHASAHCSRDCTQNANVCLSGYQCVDIGSNTKICAQTVGEGMGCNTALCANGLLCILDNGSFAHCYVDCLSNGGQCPQGETCHQYTNNGQPLAICEHDQGGSSSGGSSSGGSSSGGSSGGSSGNPNGHGFGEACDVGNDCQSGLCVSSGNNRICVTSCNPRLGHYDCPEGSGCVPDDPGNLGAGGKCMPGQVGSGEVGSECTDGSSCKYGVCLDGKCSVWCKDDHTCSNAGYTCDHADLEPGVCKPGSTGILPFQCACSTAPAGLPHPLMLLLGWMAFMSGRRRPAGA